MLLFLQIIHSLSINVLNLYDIQYDKEYVLKKVSYLICFQYLSFHNVA